MVSKINIALMLSAASGLIYEIVATNLLFFYFIRNTYSISTVFSTFLLGLGIGSILIYKLKDKIPDKNYLFGVLQLIIGVYSLIVLTNLTKIIPAIGTGGVLLSSSLVLLLPTILLGASFPLAGMIIGECKKDSIGYVYSVDLIGAVVGSLAAGFILIPIFGNIFTIQVAVSLNFLAAFCVLKGWRKRIPLMLIVIVLMLMMFVSPSDDLNSNGIHYSSASPYGEVEIKNGQLYIEGREQCVIGPDHSPEGETSIVNYSLLPFKSKDIDVVNIGLGCGNTLQSIVDYVETEVDIVEINPQVVEANKLFSEVLNHDRVNLIVGEGLDYLRTTDKSYESVIIDIENPAVIHASDIYTKESFEIIYTSLKYDGTLGLWVYRCESDEYYDIVYNTLKSVFPHVYKLNDNNFVASKKEIPNYRRYVPITENEEINTINKKALSKIYLDTCRWW
jgi:spermidine synthase